MISDTSASDGASRPRPTVSIITPSFNQGRFIERTIQSVLNQQGHFNIQYLIMDGGSTDGTIEVLRRYQDRLTWVSERDDGQVDAINKGLKCATGEIVAWINSDDTYYPGAFAKVVQAFGHHPDAPWLHSRSEIVDIADRPLRRWVSYYKHRRCQRYSFASLLTEDYIHQPGAFWRRSTMQQIGFLDPTSQLAFDYDWFLRLAKLGPPVYVPERLACVRWYPSSKSGAQFRQQLQDACAIARKHDPGSAWRDVVRRFRLWRISCAYRLLGCFEKR